MAKKTAGKKTAPALTPLGDRVLVRPEAEDEEQTTAAGIIIPQGSEKEEPKRGVVVAVGPGRRDEQGNIIEPQVSEGDTILFSSYAFDKVTIDSEEYFVVNEANILATIN